MSTFDPISWTTHIIALAVILQTTELILLRRTFDDNGVWSWNVMQQEFAAFPKLVRGFAKVILCYPNFLYLLWLTLAAALVIAAYPQSAAALSVFLLFSTIAISLRWRGTFNGGSDYMTIIVLSALAAPALFPGNSLVYLGSLYYIAFHSCSSYVIAGIAKLRSPNWRSGSALPPFVNSGPFLTPQFIQKLLDNSMVARCLAYGVLLFECTFPLALLNQSICIMYLVIGCCFHTANALLLGLNRFLFVWLATYPAVYWCSGLNG